MTLWEIDLHPAAGERDLLASAAISQAADLGLGSFTAAAARGFLLEADFTQAEVELLARELLADLVVEQPLVARVGEAALLTPPGNGAPSQKIGREHLVHVFPKPGVTDPVAASTLTAIADFGFKADAVVTLRKYWLGDLNEAQVQLLIKKLLANDSIEQAVVGPLNLKQLHVGSPAKFHLQTVPLRELSADNLVALSKERTLSLTLVEMRTVQQHFQTLGRDPTDIELESIAQTWSEHCSHKTLAGRVHYRDERGDRHFNNMLKETIFAATQKIRASLGDNDWCVSVFKDNAGIIRFNNDFHVCFKVETHNRPSAIEPYGGANTGVGGVIRDTLGTGLGAKPICNTDVFCFAPPDMPVEKLPPGVLHPRRIMRGVVSGVRDYGNRMGIPTVNGAIYFDERYVGNPLIFCGNVGLIPADKAFKETQPGDYIVAIGGRTGRDGIHGATFSSVELTSQSEKVSGGAVQVGNAITEKMVLDVLLQTRNEGLFSAVTDCGAGGFSSAVGEMGGEIGAEVWLDRAPLKYDGLTYTEIWISEAQERMVFSVPEKNWARFEAVCAAENVEAVILGKFVPTGNLTLKYHDQVVGELSMHFLHDGRPKTERQAVYSPRKRAECVVPPPGLKLDHNATLLELLGSLNIASKEWVIRQYDHEVQGGSVIKPLTGIANDGPSDAAVLRPVLNSRQGIVVACGMNPRLGELDPYHMAASAIDEAVRNCVAVGADPARIAILDNFCWGYTDRPETLGELVRAALACHDVALALGTPFISGKDSLNNEYSYDADGQRKTISIPPTLLISALGQVADVQQCVTMDLKSPGNLLYLVGNTRDELAGSHFEMIRGAGILAADDCGSEMPRVNLDLAKPTFAAMHQAIKSGTVRACHDLSEGGLAVAVAEMAFAGGHGARVRLAEMPTDIPAADRSEHFESVLLYSESNTRFLVEVAPNKQAQFEAALQGIPHAHIGEVTETGCVQIAGTNRLLVDADLATLKEAWQKPLRW